MTANPIVMREPQLTPTGMTRYLPGALETIRLYPPKNSMTRYLRRALALLPFFIIPGGNVAHADSYSNLPEADKAYVTRVCAPIRYLQSASAYRNCVEQHSSALFSSNRSALASLSFDEQRSVQMTCQERGTTGSPDYRQCVTREVNSLEDVPMVDTSSLSAKQIYTARQICADSQDRVKAYRQCVNAEVSEPGEPTLSNTQLTTSEDVLVQANTEVANETATNEPLFVTETTKGIDTGDSEILLDTSSTPDTKTRTGDSRAGLEVLTANIDTIATAKQTPSPALDATNAATSQRPLLGAAEPATADAQNTRPDSQEPADSDNLEPTTSDKPPLEVAREFAQKLWVQLKNSLEGVTGIDRIILLAALALPFLLIGFWLFMRRVTQQNSSNFDDNPADSIPTTNTTNAGPNHPIPDETNDVPWDELKSQRLHFAEQANHLFNDDDARVFVDDDTHAFAQESPPINRTTPRGKTHSPTPTGGLSALIDGRKKEGQLSLVIEFMIYWMAFTDERYEPKLKTKLFSQPDPDEHNLIKRYVLSQDFASFVDATSWLQENTDVQEREQILKLLMALLVYEEGVTPVQNTLLRFLSNAFGLTHSQLDKLFQAAFGHALPSMPRPDKPTWWDKQPQDKLDRWDARTVAQQSESVQARVKLGLPLSGDLGAQEIAERLERANLRCHANNFNLLTHREQQLAESQQIKFDQAAEALLEISE